MPTSRQVGGQFEDINILNNGNYIHIVYKYIVNKEIPLDNSNSVYYNSLRRITSTHPTI